MVERASGAASRRSFLQRAWRHFATWPVFLRFYLALQVLCVVGGAILGLVRNVHTLSWASAGMIEGALLVGIPGGVLAAVVGGIAELGDAVMGHARERRQLRR